jgi:RecA-family ATPase
MTMPHYGDDDTDAPGRGVTVDLGADGITVGSPAIGTPECGNVLDLNAHRLKYGDDAARKAFFDEARRYEPPHDDEPPPSETGDPGAGQEPPIEPFATFNASDWKDQPREPQRWLVHKRIPVAEPGIISGDGGTGKTLLGLQACVAFAAERPDWLNGIIERHGPTLVFSAEERLPVMHRDVGNILDHFGLSFDDLGDRLHFICDPDDPVLATVDPRTGLARPTRSLLRLERTVAKLKPVFVLIENAAEVYPASEIMRSPISHFMRKLLGSLTVPSEAAVGLIQHPSVAGLKEGSGRSGSTGWNNAARWRLNFTKLNDDDAPDTGVRQLEVVKANRGPTGEKVQVVWRNGVFVPVGFGDPITRAVAQAPIDDAFLACLDAVREQGINVFPHKGRGYAPAMFAGMKEARGHSRKALEMAMQRLLNDRRIWNEPFGAPSRNIRRLARSHGDNKG